MPTGIPSTRRSFFRFVLPPRSTLLADQEWKGCISPRVFTDRKSTRLNSSHGYISYAVFCLKKKKENVITAQDLHTKQPQARARKTLQAPSLDACSYISASLCSITRTLMRNHHRQHKDTRLV